jgi:hypothetical protein
MPSSRLPRGWIVLLLVLALSCAGAERKGDPARSRAATLSTEGLALVSRDDAASLDRAAELFRESLRADPGFIQARADLALVELLASAARRDEGARLASADGDALMRSGRELRERALDELRPLVRDHPRAPAVARALAVYYGLEGNAPMTAKLVAQARALGNDPWIDFAELASEIRNGDPDSAVPRLAAFASSHPSLLRARMMLARTLLDHSRTDESLRELDDLLAANPRHELALRLKSRILSPPAPLAAVPVPSEAPPPQKPGYLPRKRTAGGTPLERPVPPTHGDERTAR